MQIQSFNAELAMANLMFLRLFNNIVITRTDTKTNETKDIKVNCFFGQTSRIFKSWQNNERKGRVKLPCIAINRTGYSRNSDRLNNMHNEVKYEMTSSYRKYDLLTPVPIDINYDVTIISKYPSDIDQIASNFMIFFNPDVYVTCMHPKYEGIRLNNHVIMQDSVSEEHPDEIDGSTDDFITASFQFIFKTYLFGGSQQAKKVPQKVLSTYISSVVSACPYELTEEDLKNLDKFSGKLSTTIISSFQTTLSTYVDNPNLSDYIYDGFTPIVKNLSIGFYPVPQTSNYIEYFTEVDSYPIESQQFYVDRFNWVIEGANG